MPTARPPRRAKPTMTSCANSRLISNHEPASISRSMTSYMSKYFRWSYGTISSMDRPGFGSAAAAAGGVHHIEEGYAQPRGLFLDADDLLDGLLTPGTRLDRVVVGHDAHGAAADFAESGDHAVRRRVGFVRAGEEPVLLELGARVEQELEPVPDEELALFAELLAVLRVALLDPRALAVVAVLAGAHRGLPITGWGWSRG